MRPRMRAHHDFAGEVRKRERRLGRLRQREIRQPVVDEVDGLAPFP